MTYVGLCERTGNMARPWSRAGFDAELVDLAHGKNVLTWCPRPVDVLAAFPPCDAAARLKGLAKMRWEDCERVALRVRWLIQQCRPAVWLVENPEGSRLAEIFGEPRAKIHLGDYGFPARKRTWLWGNFTVPAPTSWWRDGCRSTVERMHSASRCITPPDFGAAFFEANAWRFHLEAAS